jgi:hypothetical protein
MSEELDRREMLEAALDQAEDGTLEAPVEKEIEVNDDPIQAENASEEKTSSQESTERDEKGRFKGKSEETSSQDDSHQESEPVAEASDVSDEVNRPTTWK